MMLKMGSTASVFVLLHRVFAQGFLVALVIADTFFPIFLIHFCDTAVFSSDMACLACFI